ncbi:MAG: cyclic pyranopterin monophosphate synthase MoaC [Nitrososphaeria archaeon]|nr:cyclic pyranopterin monophosphate synthase MoaC [Conexivisphaerales archaeon]
MKSIDIAQKSVTERTAIAKGFIKLSKESVSRIKNQEIEKGDPLTVAELKAIEAVKETPHAIAFCHSIPIDYTEAHCELKDDGVEVTVTVKSEAKTGVEMEALYGVSVALLNIWDMVKKYEKDENGQYPLTEIKNIRVLKKIKRDLKNQL